MILTYLGWTQRQWAGALWMLLSHPNDIDGARQVQLWFRKQNMEPPTEEVEIDAYMTDAYTMIRLQSEEWHRAMEVPMTPTEVLARQHLIDRLVSKVTENWGHHD